ncbi:C40 family peptidase [Robiginitalea aurantiaca]|uniref:C40 family peptidase n=1 Tax=Robiginitalea aurantiaca TaxID=3056915 RepID=A0ABT7WF20_9FLAO|nr:C40 family peptidase [Robiginitalea aurantiaca]MDM9631519.1 C40 family peptidase [Robiginitalea aurantiaca]
MRKTYILVVSCVFLTSCGVVKKNTSYSENPKVHVPAGTPEPTVESEAEVISEPPPSPTESPADAVVETALTYTGVRYKYGGTTRKGMDCSGLLYTTFLEHDISVPRTSEMLSEQGEKVKVKKVQKGDLLFFKTSRGRKKINHVGLVVDVKDEEVKFIHSTTSRGVIVSSLREGYWNHAFVKATRLY